MHKILLAALAVALILPATASARIIEIGDIGTPATPSCPTTPCEVISRTTAYQTRIGAQKNMFVVPRDGRIVAWSMAGGLQRWQDEGLPVDGGGEVADH